MGEPLDQAEEIAAGAEPASLPMNPPKPNGEVSRTEPPQLPLPAATPDDPPTIISRKAQAALQPNEKLEETLRGRKLAHFELIEAVGVGGMAAVIRARDSQLERTVALKILPPDMARDPENVRRFHQEARAAAKLDHENIARVFYCGEDQGLHFIAFEFVEGDNLRTILDRRGRLPMAEAISYMLQIATGLAHSAARGVVHRDIKPSNIIIATNGRAKLVDMGLARSMEPQKDAALTQSGVTLGTFDYISPEQALEPRDADIRSDIYSLGCTFYHMLTGQPPVPDGTAAKKLHHHQHVDPVDPRQLNPEISDEVAALLARMMAKRLEDRYQTPEHLVRHLVLLAQKLGALVEVPDAALFADPPLPPPPRVRPVVLAACAVVALVLLVLVLQPGSRSAFSPSALPDAVIKDGGGTSTQASNATQNPVSARAPASSHDDTHSPVPDTADLHAHSIEELLAFLERPATNETYRIFLKNDLHVKREQPIDFYDRNVILQPESGGEGTLHPRIIVEYDSLPIDKTNPANKSNTWTGITVRGGSVNVRGIHFVLNAHQSPDLDMAAVQLWGGQLTLSNCEFEQEDTPEGSRQVTSVKVGGEKSHLTVERCYFGPGQCAIAVNSPATLRFTDCLFASHTDTFFNLATDTGILSDPESVITLAHCSLVTQGRSAFRIAGAAGRLVVHDCLFSRPDTMMAAVGGTLIEQGGTVGGWRFDGAYNCYHTLRAFWVNDSDPDSPQSSLTLATFRQRPSVRDEHSVELVAADPWENSDPVQSLRENPGARSIRINTRLPDLSRVVEGKRRFVGVEHSLWGDLYTPGDTRLAAEVPGTLERPARRSERIFDPTAAPSPQQGIYQRLNQAIEDAQPGDVVLLRFNGLQRVEPIRLDKADADITLQPDRTCHPVLSIGNTTEPDSALFQVHDGKLRLEGLEFHLAPSRLGFKAQTVVAIMGDGQVSIKDCLTTLQATRDVPLSFITLGDPSGVMKMNPQPAATRDPRIEIDNCFVRGVGNMVNVRASRPFSLRIERSLVALDGSFLSVEGNPKEPKRPAEVTLKQVTTFLTDHLLWLKAYRDEGRNTKGLAVTTMQASDCLFAAATGKTLVHVEGLDNDDQVRKFLICDGGAHNAYWNFTNYLDGQPVSDRDVMPPTPYPREQWERFTQEAGDRFDRVARFVSTPSTDALARVVPGDFHFKLDTGMQDFGPDLDRLPKPSLPSVSGTSAPE
jgi:serine/threonine protein kinase